MCSRYYIYPRLLEAWSIDEKTIENFIGKLPRDIHPSEQAIVMYKNQSSIGFETMTWGYPAKEGISSLINARCESVVDKPTFARGISKHRCIIPASGFYEWSPLKEMASFRHPRQETLYLAGCFDVFEGKKQFVILTREAYGPGKKIHGRMPLILYKEDIRFWLQEDLTYIKLLRHEAVELEISMPLRQQTLFDDDLI